MAPRLAACHFSRPAQLASGLAYVYLDISSRIMHNHIKHNPQNKLLLLTKSDLITEMTKNRAKQGKDEDQISPGKTGN